MRRFFFIFTAILQLAFPIYAEEAQKICLNMIVKDESHVIRRCLDSVKPLIDYWVIVDTGSTDGTQDIIREYLSDIPGELHESAWVDFGHNRNEALMLAKGKGTHLLIIDADDTLDYAPGYRLPHLDKDGYYISIVHAGSTYKRIQLIDNRQDWVWIGALHEALSSAKRRSSAVLEGVKYVFHGDGRRTQNQDKFLRDVEILEKAVSLNPENARNVFYLAQSHKDAKQYRQAIDVYGKRAEMGGWDQEVFWSLLQLGVMQEILEEEESGFLASYQKAYTVRPSRAEPLYRIANFYRRNERYQEGYQASAKALAIPLPDDTLFVEKWIYDYGSLLEFSICAYWVGHYREAFLASTQLLKDPSLPAHIRECIERNHTWIKAKYSQIVD